MKKFFESKSKNEKALYEFIYNQMIEANPNIENFANENVDKVLHSFESVSTNTLTKYFNYIRKIYKYACEQKGVAPKNLKPTKSMHDYVNLEKLRQQIITPQDYKFLCEELDIYYEGHRVNLRDKVLVELAWEGLTSDEVKNLKKTDIQFVKDEYDRLIKAKLQLSDKVVWIDDSVVVEDLKGAISEDSYHRFDKIGRVLTFPYKDSEYVIRPIAIREDVARSTISNLSLVFRQIMKRTSLDYGYKSRNADGTEYVLDVKSMNMESIRRSKIIWLLSHDITFEMARDLLGKNQNVDLIWLRRISRMIYNSVK